MIEKTEALLLRTHPYSQTSRLVIWLSPERGRIATLLKGACRPKSPFLGQIDLPDTCELVFYAHTRSGVHIARECSPLRRRSALRQDWRRYAAAEYVCHLLHHVCMADHPQQRLFHQAEALLDFFCDHAATPQALFQWELQTLQTLGLAPQLMGCTLCGRPHHPEAGPERWTFSPRLGGLVCPLCGRSQRQGRGLTLPRDVAAMLRRWLHSTAPHTAHRTCCSPRQLALAERLLGQFIEHHLDSNPKARAIALHMLTQEPEHIVARRRTHLTQK